MPRPLIFHSCAIASERVEKDSVRINIHGMPARVEMVFSGIVFLQIFPHILRRSNIISLEALTVNDINVEQVGVPGFEPGTSCSQSKRASHLRYTPKNGFDRRPWRFQRHTPANGVYPALRDDTPMRREYNAKDYFPSSMEYL